MSNQTFQLSVLSQNDSGAADGAVLVCEVLKINNGTLSSGSFPINSTVNLPIPPNNEAPAPATPTWFLIPSGNISNTSFEIQISCPTDPSYPTTQITINASDVEKWGSIPYDDRDNQIYSKGEYGIFGFAQIGPNGLIYTVTAGVLNPQLIAY